MYKFLFLFLLVPTLANAQADIVARCKSGSGPVAAANSLKCIAKELNKTSVQYGVLRKTAGENCAGYSCDIICTLTDQWDVFIAADGGNGPMIPTWDHVATPNWQQGCELISPDSNTNTNPTPTPQPSGDLYVLLAKVLENQQIEIRNQERIVVLLEYQVKQQEQITVSFDQFRGELRKLKGVNWKSVAAILSVIVPTVIGAK